MNHNTLCRAFEPADERQVHTHTNDIIYIQPQDPTRSATQRAEPMALSKKKVIITPRDINISINIQWSIFSLFLLLAINWG